MRGISTSIFLTFKLSETYQRHNLGLIYHLASEALLT